MSDSRATGINHLSRADRIDLICDSFEKERLSGKEPQIEEYLDSAPEQEREDLLRELLAIELECRWQSGETPEKSEYVERFAQYREVISGLFDIQANTVSVDDDTTGPADHRPPGALCSGHQQFGDYELLGELGRGGMGVVYKARQKKLNRLVAVKMIRAAELAGDEQVKRFKSEAEAAGQLDHPGIVPVHEVGEIDGCHFFSMGFIPGAGLDARLKEGPVDPRESAQLVESVAEAVQFAHEKGIIHRDLKPANVLIDNDGRPRVTDFGLAKRVDADNQMSVTGQIMGTPGYMPPEQAEGKVNEIDKRADVYALGAMLYAMLTGRPPFQAATAIETIRQVIDQEAIAPRQLNAAIPKDLETICLKCLQKNPQARYGSAQAVADDLRRYLDGRPIAARPIGPLALGWRWCRRNRAIASLLTLVVALLVLGSIGSTIAAFQMRRARNKIADAKTVADEQRQKAEEAEAATIAEFEASTDDGIELLIGSKPSLSEQERTYLQRTLKRWQAFADRVEDDERTLAIRGDAHFRIGYLWSKLDRRADSQREYERALEIRKQLVERFPTTLHHYRDLGTTHNNYGILLKDQGKYDQALRQYEEALRIRQEITRRFPEDGDYLLDLAVAHNNLGGLLEDVGRYETSRQHFERAINMLRDVTQRFPDVSEVRLMLARTYHNLGDSLFKTGDREQCAEEFEKARSILTDLASQEPSPPKVRRALASLIADIGTLLSRTGQLQEASKEYGAACEIQTRLVQEFPAMPGYQVELGRTHNNLGKLFHTLQQFDDAMVSLQQALQFRQALVDQFPGIPLHDHDLGRTHYNLGLVLGSQSKLEEARHHFEQAHQIQTDLVERFENDSTYLQDLAVTLTMLGSVDSAQKDPASAISDLQQALAIQRKLVAQVPNIPTHRIRCAFTCYVIGTICFESGNPSDCLEWSEEAISLLEDTRDQFGDDHDAMRHLKQAQALKAETLNSLERYNEAVAVWQLARDLGNEGEQLLFSAKLANSLVRAGDVAEGVSLADQLTGKKDIWPAGELYNFACLYSVAAAKIVQAPKLSTEENATLSKTYADKALALLKHVASNNDEGFFASEEGRSLLATDPDLDPLRSRAEFRELATSVGVELPDNDGQPMTTPTDDANR